MSFIQAHSQSIETIETIGIIEIIEIISLNSLIPIIQIFSQSKALVNLNLQSIQNLSKFNQPIAYNYSSSCYKQLYTNKNTIISSQRKFQLLSPCLIFFKLAQKYLLNSTLPYRTPLCFQVSFCRWTGFLDVSALSLKVTPLKSSFILVSFILGNSNHKTPESFNYLALKVILFCFQKTMFELKSQFRVCQVFGYFLVQLWDDERCLVAYKWQNIGVNLMQIKLTNQKSLKFEINYHKQQMQTDRSNKIFSILKNTSDCLVLQNQDAKFFRKTFILKQQTLNHLIERQKLTHSNLINLHKIEFSHFLNQGKFAVDIIFEHYCKTLDQCIMVEYSQCDHSEIINTFQPILELVDHLRAQNFHLSDFSLKNVVITEDQSVKFLDSFLQNKQITKLQISKDTNNFNDNKIYHKIAENLFTLLCPNYSSNNWKIKMKILKQQCSKQTCTFVSSVLTKSSSKGCDNTKTKKIKKTVKVRKSQNVEGPLGKLYKEQKRQKDGISTSQINMYGKHQGKENKLQQ